MITSLDPVIVIPTLGRVGEQLTLECLPPAWHARTWLCVPASEAAAHHHDRLLVHDNINGVAKTRQFIHEHTDAPIVFMLDDDLEFYIRRQNDPPRLRGATPDEVGACFDQLVAWLHEDPHLGLVAVSQRRGNNWETAYASDTAGRPCRVWGYRHFTLDHLAGFRFDDVHSVEDFHMALSLLRAGYRIRTVYHWAQGQKASNQAGGCSTNRTAETHDADMRTLAALHPGYVKLVKKTTKGGWFGGERTDAVISWAKAASERTRHASPQPDLFSLDQ